MSEIGFYVNPCSEPGGMPIPMYLSQCDLPVQVRTIYLQSLLLAGYWLQSSTKGALLSPASLPCSAAITNEAPVVH
jgi:hypothetical protein